MTAFPDSPFGEFDRLALPPTPLAVIRHDGMRFDDLQAAFDSGFAALGQAANEGLVVPVGPALAIYHGNPMEVFDMEIGFPVSAALDAAIPVGGVEIVAAQLPEGDAVATTYLGAYDGLGEAWGRLVDRAVSEGLTARGISIEVYVSDPTEAPERLRTDLILPLA